MITKDLSSGEFTGMSQTNCISVTRLRDQGLSTRRLITSGPGFPLAFVAILPASHHGQDWTPEVTTDRGATLRVTDESLLILFDGDEHPKKVRIDITCGCGDIVYEPKTG